MSDAATNLDTSAPVTVNVQHLGNVTLNSSWFTSVEGIEGTVATGAPSTLPFASGAKLFVPWTSVFFCTQ
jgi:hypothetical protein